jgi:lipid A disaccharide synthetase
MEAISFSDIAIVSCGTVSMELNHLKKEGFLVQYRNPRPMGVVMWDWLCRSRMGLA